jgi:hypothetical protein
LNKFEKEKSRRLEACSATPGDLSEIIGELLFFDDKKAISIRLNQPKVTKPLHERTEQLKNIHTFRNARALSLISKTTL